MQHTREEVIERTAREFKLLDQLVADLSPEQWELLVPRPETKDPWTVKDALAHITHWKADKARSALGRPIPPEERGLNETDGNHLIYLRWHDRLPQEVLAWHRQVQEEVLTALRTVPDKWFSAREHAAEWPYDMEGHSAFHRQRDIERALKT